MMAAHVLVPLAEGCEEIEAVTIIDLLRRAGVEVTVAGLESGPITASRGVFLLADTTLEELDDTPFDMIVLPGGGPGSDALDRDERIRTLLRAQYDAGRYVAAICAAPKVLAHIGLLDGRKATAFPGTLEGEPGAIQLQDDPVVIDGKIVTSRGPGTAMVFALTLIELLLGESARQTVDAGLQRV